MHTECDHRSKSTVDCVNGRLYTHVIRVDVTANRRHGGESVSTPSRSAGGTPIAIVRTCATAIVHAYVQTSARTIVHVPQVDTTYIPSGPFMLHSVQTEFHTRFYLGYKI